MKKPITTLVPVVLLGAAAVAVLAYGINAYRIYLAGHAITDDKTGKNNNINVMLTRPENWRRIQSGGITLSAADFAKIDGSTATVPITAELARQFLDADDDALERYVDHNTTHPAYLRLIYKASEWNEEYYPININEYQRKDIIFVTEPSEEERKIAKDHGITLDVTPIALDGFVFITHKDNPVDSLTPYQIRRIYSGEITNWSEVGGNDEEIIPYQRESNSGSQTAMQQLVMKGRPMMQPKEGYITVQGMADLVEHIAEYENAQNSLGYTYYYYLSNLYRSDDIKVLAIDGVLPDNEHLQSGEYPFTTAYYAVIRAGDTGFPLMLRDYLVSDEGQQIIELAGYCRVEN